MHTGLFLNPKLHFDTNLIFVSLLVPEIFAHFFCPSGKFFLEKMKYLCQDFHYMYFTTTFATKSAKICPMVLGVLSPAGGLLRRGLASAI
jgi:hypothetical protein